MSKQLKYIILALLVAIGIVGCAPVVKPEQSAVVETALLDNGSIGQTFVAHHDGLEGIDLYLEPVEAGDGNLYLQLRSGPQDSENVGVGSLSLENISAPGFYHITITPQKYSTQQDYYLHLRIKGQGSVNVGTAPGNTYINGALYRNLQPQDAQLAFNLIYSPRLL
ncbi:MAG: hypothetical protein KKG47_16990, partial [Proteobacteria bacterium]|nr:hypothetical protein [Pseudomonadota bacterium]